jgi:hypothetical protein
VATFTEKPEVSICDQELLEYKWFDWHQGFKNIGKVSIPTRNLLSTLENVNIHHIAEFPRLRDQACSPAPETNEGNYMSQM